MVLSLEKDSHQASDVFKGLLNIIVQHEDPKTITEHTATINIYFLARGSKNKTIDIADAVADLDMRVTTFKDIVEKSKNYNQQILFDGYSLIPLSTGKELRQFEIAYMILTDHPFIKGIVDKFRATSIPDINFNNKNFIKGIFAHIVSFRFGDDEPILYIRKHIQGHNIKKKSHLLNVIQTLNGQSSIVKDPFCFMDNEIDCIVQGDHLFIINQDHFQDLFDYHHEIDNDAKIALSKLQNKNFISNFDEFAQSIGNSLQKKRQLCSILHEGIIDCITIADIINVQTQVDNAGKQHNIKIVKDNGIDKLKFIPGRRNNILTLLHNDYIKKLLTNEIDVIS